MRPHLLALLLLWASPTAAQEPEVSVEARVTSSERGKARIDRGSVDGLLPRDIVLFFPREGGSHLGRIVALEERAGEVELQDPAFTPAPGMRVEIRIPRERLNARAAAPVRLPSPSRTPEVEPRWKNQDQDWEPGQPLLAKVRPVRPEERPSSFHGRVYGIFDYTDGSEDNRQDVLYRAGWNTVWDNLLGHGERLQFDGEWNYRDLNLPDGEGQEDVELRLDRLSYATGGTRFEPERWEVGRFLQSGVPEFGVLDGAEWLVRRRNGHRYGASVGFMPEPDIEYETGSDLQVAGFYEWAADESGELTASGGYQKTFHNGAADRDLFVTSFRRLPRTGWTLLGTAWVDYYSDSDDKGTLFGLTQLYLTTGRRWQDRSSLDLVYSHTEFPDLERQEFQTVTEQQLADDHNDRLGLQTRLQLTRDARLLTSVGAWVDEDESGGDVEIGVGLEDVVVEKLEANVALFGTRGRFLTGLGARFHLGRLVESGRWSLDYEFAQNRLDGFSSANDDLPQHRLNLSRDQRWLGWDISWRLGGVFYDDEEAFSVGLYLQRTF